MEEGKWFKYCSVLADGVIDFSAGSTLFDLPVDLHLIRGELLMEDNTIVHLTIKEETVLYKENKLLINYPNPFNPDTTIPFVVAQDGHVDLKVYNSLGQNVRSLFSGYIRQGHYSFDWDARDNAGISVASGVYFYRLHVKDKVFIRRLLLVR